MHDVVRQQHHPLMDFMPGLPALGRAGRSTAKKTLDTVAVRLAAAVVLALVSVAPAWAVDDSVPVEPYRGGGLGGGARVKSGIGFPMSVNRSDL